MTNFLPTDPKGPGSIGTALTPGLRPAGDDLLEPALQSVDLKELVATLRRHAWVIVATVLAAFSIAAYVAYSVKPTYVARAVVRLTDTRRQMTNGISDPMYGNSVNMFTDPIQSQIQVLSSRAVATEVVRRNPLGLQVVPVDFSARLLDSVRLTSEDPADTLTLSFGDSIVTVRGPRHSASVPYGRTVEVDGVVLSVRDRWKKDGHLVARTLPAAANLVMANLSAKQRKTTDVLDVEFSADDPYVAQDVANTAVQVFKDFSASTAKQQSTRRRQFLEEQVHETDSLLAKAEDALSDFRTRKQVYGSDAQIAAQQTGILDLEARRGEMAADREVYQKLLQNLGHTSDTVKRAALRAIVSSPEIATNPVVAGLYAQLVQFQGAHDSLTTGRWAAAPTDPDVQRVNVLIANTEQRLVSAVESHITSLDARIAALDDLRAQNAAELQKLPATQAVEARLLQQVEGAGKLADQLRAEYQRARIDEAVEAGQVEILDLATKPSKPVGTRTRVKLLVGIIIGLLFGTGAALLLERLNTAIRRREEVERVLQVPSLAIIPQIIGEARPAGRLGLGRLRLPRGNGGSGNGTPRSDLVTISDLRSGSAEAFRTLRTSLIFSQAIQTLRTIVVTSPSPQDGKTTTAANLAVTFAQQGMRVLLVDCDMRRGRLHTIFRVAREPGLSQLILDSAALPKIAQQTFVDRLSFIASGSIPPNPSELLGSMQMRNVLTTLASQYDVVILDTPPVHVAGDALILGAQADGVILVVRAGQTDRGSAQDALTRLTGVGARVVGAVLNDPDHKVPQYGGYYYYDYYYAEE